MFLNIVKCTSIVFIISVSPQQSVYQNSAFVTICIVINDTMWTENTGDNADIRRFDRIGFYSQNGHDFANFK